MPNTLQQNPNTPTALDLGGPFYFSARRQSWNAFGGDTRHCGWRDQSHRAVQVPASEFQGDRPLHGLHPSHTQPFQLQAGPIITP